MPTPLKYFYLASGLLLGRHFEATALERTPENLPFIPANTTSWGDIRARLKNPLIDPAIEEEESASDLSNKDAHWDFCLQPNGENEIYRVTSQTSSPPESAYYRNAEVRDCGGAKPADCGNLSPNVTLFKQGCWLSEKYGDVGVKIYGPAEPPSHFIDCSTADACTPILLILLYSATALAGGAALFYGATAFYNKLKAFGQQPDSAAPHDDEDSTPVAMEHKTPEGYSRVVNGGP